METVLLSITFVFGVLRLLTFTPVFQKNLSGIIEVILPIGDYHPISKFLDWFEYIIFYFSLCYQAWYWLFR